MLGFTPDGATCIGYISTDIRNQRTIYFAFSYYKYATLFKHHKQTVTHNLYMQPVLERVPYLQPVSGGPAGARMLVALLPDLPACGVTAVHLCGLTGGSLAGGEAELDAPPTALRALRNRRQSARH